MGSSNPRDERRADLSQLKPLSPIPWGGSCRATDNYSLHSTLVSRDLVVAVSKRFRCQALSWYSELEKPLFPVTLLPMPSPSARAKCHRYTGMRKRRCRGTTLRHTWLQGTCSQMGALEGTAEPSCPRASALPAFPCSSCTAPKRAPRTPPWCVRAADHWCTHRCEVWWHLPSCQHAAPARADTSPLSAGRQ